MGQLLSRQVTPDRPSYYVQSKSDVRSQRSRRGKTSSVRFDDVPTTSRSSHRPERTTSGARNAPSVPRSKSRLVPLNEIDGNLGSLRRQQKYGRGKTSSDSKRSRDHVYPRTRKTPEDENRDHSKHKEEEQAKSRTPQTNARHKKRHATRECVICTDIRPVHRFPDRAATSLCTHPSSVCRRCLRTWIQSEFSTKIWNEINCPVCANRMQYDDMQEFAPRDVFRRYDTLTTKAVYESIPNYRWCITKGCKSGQVHPPGTSRFRCKSCRKSHCVVHLTAWHKGETCGEYDYRTNKHIKREEEAASKKIIADTTKKCPGCKRSIEKSYGCDHMTCLKCKHEFCWECLAPYRKKGERRVVHKHGCVHHEAGWDSD